ncbi:bifunctional diguanylate cyclase/phosphodiesterase [Ruegeria sp. Ofav3-42]|uniref:putative bifunctional diguanylate cyclase/phosphodiesterase n=1 Tax=Ruegeria sp. Ofav3-42 TaxID=2917759 RepID=UPI001EF4AC0B|nr:bifunctional diguanylate cyclase/phosphodiesterase [Ruegeria sp. Ofav3-42]MCG7522253.1 bifunctional diguanylate cyclase/phosphodiesterase [Ruegeria sp. Ofav3-42]
MWKHISVNRILDFLATALSGPPALAFAPAISLAAYWIGGERALIIVALALPLVFAAAVSVANKADIRSKRNSGLLPIDAFAAGMEDIFKDNQRTGHEAACMIVELDGFPDFLDLHGNAAGNLMADQFRARVASVIRSQDMATGMDQSKISIGLHGSQNLDLEACIQMSGRIQAAVEEPITLNGTSVYMSCSIGFCLQSTIPEAAFAEWIDAANAALGEAQRNGPATIRAYSSETQRRARIRANLRKEFVAALDSGEIRPWFQPQISTDTGHVTGFEALARWEHPQKGVLGPQIFLPFAEQADLMERLGQVMRHHAFAAMQKWDRTGVIVPRIGVNFSSDELRDPALIDRLKWELDQNDLTPDRLAVEILETVFSRRPDDVITRNVTSMSNLGCCIDLDDFGTGHASIASVKRFDVSRIKIDRSFVAKADRDASQQQLVSAILTMAERLNVETLAEGVESPGEHALMAQLGCDHVQGFGIGKPMPFEKTMDWMLAHQNKINGMPKIGRQARP